MKRAPIIPKSIPSVVPVTTVSAPAAPMVDTLIARVGAMAKGNTITLPVCGREVKFILETIPGADVASSTKVWFVTLKKQDDCRIQIWNYEDALNSALAIPLSK